MKVNWTERARYRLRHIRDYLNEQAPAVTQPAIEGLVRRSRLLRDQPHIGRKVPEYQREDLREILERPYRLIYRLFPNRIDVITVMHYRQLLPNDLNELLKPMEKIDLP